LKKPSRRVSVGQRLNYRIKVQGRIEDRWSNWFDGIEPTVTMGRNNIPITTLDGTALDQAAVQGLLRKLHTLGFVILTITCTDFPDGED
jgi:hypothetical protein